MAAIDELKRACELHGAHISRCADSSVLRGSFEHVKGAFAAALLEAERRGETKAREDQAAAEALGRKGLA